MARPRTPVGTWGTIFYRQAGSKREAVAWFRMSDGRSKQVSRTGKSDTQARNRLLEKLRDLAKEATAGSIDPDTRFGKICDLYEAELRRNYKLAGKTSSTPRLYAGYIKNWIRPALGELAAREVLAGPCDALIQRGRDKSYDTATSLRTVLSGICDYAVRHGAMGVNPTKSTARLTRGYVPPVKAMTLEQRLDLIAKLEELAERKSTDALGRKLGRRSDVWQQLPDIVRAMLSTGVRLGELLALNGTEVDPQQRTVLVAHHLVQEPGEGLLRVPNRKGDGEGLRLGVPHWSVPMWRERKLASGGGPVFPSWNGSYASPSNVIKRIREAMNDEQVGYGWVTSHIWRKTVATVLDEAGLPTTAIADQLGNTPKVIEQHYRAKRQTNQQAQEALEGMMGS